MVIQDTDVCVLSCARTPIGSFGGKLKSFSATQLGSLAIKEALARCSANVVHHVDEVYMGNVLSAGLGQAPARQAALGAGLPASVPCTTVNKVCASGMKAVALGAAQIALGSADVVVCGGMESMSNTPFYAPAMRFGNKFGSVPMIDGLAFDGLEDAYSKDKMGNCAELCAAELGYTRQQQDAYTATSYARAAAATASNKFADEMFTVMVPGGRGKPSVAMDADEECTARSVTAATLAEMRPAGFVPPAGHAATVTAGSASTISDGACAIVLASGSYVKRMGSPVAAIVRGWGDAAQAPEWFTTAPALAIPKALTHAGVSIEDVDAWEINEAFSVVAMANMSALKIPHEKLNVYGGAVSLGHPLGCSGARILCTLLSTLKNEGGTLGCAGICNGGGGASALVLERVIDSIDWERTSKL